MRESRPELSADPQGGSLPLETHLIQKSDKPRWIVAFQTQNEVSKILHTKEVAELIVELRRRLVAVKVEVLLQEIDRRGVTGCGWCAWPRERRWRHGGEVARPLWSGIATHLAPRLVHETTSCVRRRWHRSSPTLRSLC